MTHDQALSWAIGRLRELEAMAADSPAEQQRLAETITRLRAQREQRRQMADWVSLNLSTVSTKLPPDVAERFREACIKRGETVYSALRRLIQESLAS